MGLTLSQAIQIAKQAVRDVQQVIYRPRVGGRMDVTPVIREREAMVNLIAAEYLGGCANVGEKIEECVELAICRVISMQLGMGDAEILKQFGGKPGLETLTNRKVTPADLEIEW